MPCFGNRNVQSGSRMLQVLNSKTAMNFGTGTEAEFIKIETSILGSLTTEQLSFRLVELVIVLPIVPMPVKILWTQLVRVFPIRYRRQFHTNDRRLYCLSSFSNIHWSYRSSGPSNIHWSYRLKSLWALLDWPLRSFTDTSHWYLKQHIMRLQVEVRPSAAQFHHLVRYQENVYIPVQFP